MKDDSHSSDEQPEDVPLEPDPMGSSDETHGSLLEAVQLGRPGSWSRLDSIYRRMVIRWGRQFGLRDHDAEDVVQEVFLRVKEKISDFQRQRVGSFRAWLKKITFYLVCDFRKRQKDPPALGGSGNGEMMAWYPDASPDEVDKNELFWRILEAIRPEFEESTWEAAMMVLRDVLTPTEVAKELSITRNAVYIAVSRVRKQARQMLADLGEQP